MRARLRTREHTRVARALTLAFSVWLVLASACATYAASPLPSGSPLPFGSPLPSGSPLASAQPGIIETGDPRSNGQGPGLVGSPFAILAGVVLLGIVTAGGTLLYLRVTRRT